MITPTETLAAARARALTDLEWRAMVELYDAKALQVAELEARNAEHERAAKARIAELEGALQDIATGRHRFASEVAECALADATNRSPR